VRYYWYIYILYYITYIIIEWFPWIRPWLWSISQVLESVLLFTPKIAGAYGCSSPVSVVSWPLAMLSAPPNGRRPGRRACRARRARARHMGSNGFAKKHTHEKKKRENPCFFHELLHGFSCMLNASWFFPYSMSVDDVLFPNWCVQIIMLNRFWDNCFFWGTGSEGAPLFYLLSRFTL
jgi:hypothetical protein